MYWIGLDVGERETRVCALDEQNATAFERTVPTRSTEVGQLLSEIPRSQISSIVMETGVGRRLASELRDLGFPVTVLSGIKTRQFLAIRQNKTDTNDALGLAEIARTGAPALFPVHLKSQKIRDLRSKLVLRNQLMEQKIDLQNAMRAFLFEQGIARKLPHGKRFRSELEELLAPCPVEHAETVRREILAILPVLEAIRAYLAAANKCLENYCDTHPLLSRFTNIPGVGKICAISFYTAVEDPSRFQRCSDVGAYFGIVPKVKQSGSVLHKSRITKAGNRLTRSHLVMAANVLLSFDKRDSALRDWGLSVAARSGRAKAKVAVARKLSVLMLSIWKSGEDFIPYPDLLTPAREAGLDADHITAA